MNSSFRRRLPQLSIANANTQDTIIFSDFGQLIVKDVIPTSKATPKIVVRRDEETAEFKTPDTQSKTINGSAAQHHEWELDESTSVKEVNRKKMWINPFQIFCRKQNKAAVYAGGEDDDDLEAGRKTHK